MRIIPVSTTFGVLLSGAQVISASTATPPPTLTVGIWHGLPSLEWPNTPGDTYVVERCVDLSFGDWESVACVTTDSTSGSWKDESDSSRTRFYRLAIGVNSEVYGKLQTALQEDRSNRGIPGIAAAVMMPGRTPWVGTSGISHVDGSGDETRPIRPDTRFNIASLTKTFTASLILQLAEEGHLRLEDTVADLLPELDNPNIPGEITVHQLLAHSSGIHNFVSSSTFNDAKKAEPERLWRKDEALDYLQLPVFEPGTSYQYCNTGYILLGLIAESVTGNPLHLEFRRRFFDPMGLNGSYLDTREPTVGQRSHYYVVDGEGFAKGFHWDPTVLSRTSTASPAWAAGAMLSTAFDTVRWGASLYGGNILRPNSLEQMLTLNTWPNGQRGGMGVFQVWSLGLTYIGHTGSFLGHHAELWRCLNNRATVCVTRNKLHGGFYSTPLGAASAITSVLATEILTFRWMPRDQSVEAGGEVTFRCSAAASSEISYQWQFNGADLLGERQQFLTLSNLDSRDAGIYTVVLRDEQGGSLDASAKLTIVSQD